MDELKYIKLKYVFSVQTGFGLIPSLRVMESVKNNAETSLVLV